MAHPFLQIKTEETRTIDADASRLFQVIFNEQKKAAEAKGQDREEPRINVSVLISKMSFYYEKIRNMVDYKEEYLLRKNAVERILRRQIVIESVIKQLNLDEIAKHLLTELIRAGYLPNNNVPIAKITEISQVIEKYIVLRHSCHQAASVDFQTKNELSRWMIALAASEIEERLGDSEIDGTVVKNMYGILKDGVELPDDSPYLSDLQLQIYIGIHRSFLKYDRDMLSYIIFKYYVSGWKTAGRAEADRIGRQLLALKTAIDRQIDHPLSRQLSRLISRYTIFFRVLTEIIQDNPVSSYLAFKQEAKSFAKLVKEKCEENYKRAKKKLWRSALRSIIYIFITKSVFAVLLEVPTVAFFGGEINNFALAVNVSFPALLLYLIVLFSKQPGEENTKKIIEGIEEIVFTEKKRSDKFRLYTPAQRSVFINTFFGLFYAVTFLFSFGAVIWALNKINFNWVSIVIFLFFLTLVSFFASRIRRGIKEVFVVEPKENILSFLSDFFYTPIILAGKWISEKFSRVNVFVFILDFIIEAPFKIFVEVAEEWSRYVKERKDGIM